MHPHKIRRITPECRKARAAWLVAFENLKLARIAYRSLRELTVSLSLEDEIYDASGREAASVAEKEAFRTWERLHPHPDEVYAERSSALRTL